MSITILQAVCLPEPLDGFTVIKAVGEKRQKRVTYRKIGVRNVNRIKIQDVQLLPLLGWWVESPPQLLFASCWIKKKYFCKFTVTLKHIKQQKNLSRPLSASLFSNTPLYLCFLFSFVVLAPKNNTWSPQFSPLLSLNNDLSRLHFPQRQN